MKNEVVRKTVEVIQVNGKNIEVKCNEEHARYLFDTISDNNLAGMDLYFNNCELIAELRDSKGFYLLGYDSFKDMASDLFEQGETQAKNMCLIAKKYGSRLQDGRYTIIDRDSLKAYTPTQLLQIGNLKEFNGSLEDTTKKYGITPSTTCAELRETVAQEKSDKKEDKKAQATTKEDGNTEPMEEVEPPKTEKALDIKLSYLKKQLKVGMKVYIDLGNGMTEYLIIE